MATRTETVLLGVKIDQAAAKKQAEELTVAIRKERNELAGLEKQFEAGEIAEKEYGAEKVRLTKSISENSRQLTINTGLVNAQKNSIAADRAELARLTDAYIKSANPTKAQAKEIKNLSDKLKENESAIGDNRRNVGNYTQSILDAAKQLPIFGGAIQKTESSLQGLKAVFSSTAGSVAGVIAIIAALIALPFIAFATQADDGIDSMEQKFNGLKAVLNVVLDRFATLGRSLNNLSFSLQSFKDVFSGLGEQIKHAYEEEVRLTKQSQDLDDAEAKLSVTLLKRQGIIDKNILQARDQNKTFQERLSGLKEAGELELANLKDATLLAQQRLDIEKQRNKLDKEKDEGEALKREAELQTKVIQLQNDAAQKKQEIANRTSSLQQQLITDTLAEQKKAFDQELKNNSLVLDQESAQRATELQNGLVAYQKFEGELAKLRTQRIKDDADASLERYNATKAALEALRDLGINVDKELADNEEQFRQEQIQGDIDANNQIFQNQQRHEAKMKHLQELRFQSAQAISSAIGELESLLAKQGAENTDFAKALALAQIAIDTAVAIGKATAAAAGEPFPANVIAIGTSIAAVLSAISRTEGLINKANTPTPPQFGGGGDFLTNGPQLIMVGDNPGGVERVTVEPLSGRGQTRLGKGANLLHLAGGGSVTAVGAGQLAQQTIINQVNNQLATGNQMAAIMDRVKIVLPVENLDRVQEQIKRVEVNSTI